MQSIAHNLRASCRTPLKSDSAAWRGPVREISSTKVLSICDNTSKLEMNVTLILNEHFSNCYRGNFHEIQ